MALMPSLGLRPTDEPLHARVVLGLAFQFVPDGSISFEPLLVHPREHRNVCIHVVVNPNNLLAVVNSMQATHELLQGAAPRNRHRQEQRVEPRIVKTLAYVASGGQDYAWNSVWNRGEFLGCRLALLLAHAEK